MMWSTTTIRQPPCAAAVRSTVRRSALVESCNWVWLSLAKCGAYGFLAHLPTLLFIEWMYWYLNPYNPPAIVGSDLPAALFIGFAVWMPAAALAWSVAEAAVATTNHNHPNNRVLLWVLFQYHCLSLLVLFLLAAIGLSTFLAFPSLSRTTVATLLVVLLTGAAGTILVVPEIIIYLSNHHHHNNQHSSSLWIFLRRSVRLTGNNWRCVAMGVLSYAGLCVGAVALVVAATRHHRCLRPALLLPLLSVLTSLWNLHLRVLHARCRRVGVEQQEEEVRTIIMPKQQQRWEEAARGGGPGPKAHDGIPRRRRLRLFHSTSIIVWMMLFVGLCVMIGLGHRSLVYQQQPVTAPSYSSAIYSRARIDRIGSQVLDRFLYHAYARARRVPYGGSCLDAHERRAHVVDRTARVADLLQSFHNNVTTTPAADAFPIACPPGGYHDRSARFVPFVVPWMLAKWTVTDAWLDEVRSLFPYQQRPKREEEGVYTIVAHIRRQDVSPCIGYSYHRYLPNLYYTETIDKYVRSAPDNTTVRVIVHTQKRFFEDLDEFQARNNNNCTIRLDKMTTIADAWREMMTADVLIMSRSSLSVVAALLNRRGVVVYPFFAFFPKLPEWTQADSSLLERSRREVERLKAEKCAGNKLTYQRKENSGVLQILNHGITNWIFPF